MATEPDNTPKWIFDFLTGRSAGEIAEIRAFVEAAFPVKVTEENVSTLTDEMSTEEYHAQDKSEGRRRFAEAYSDFLRARGAMNDPRVSDTIVNIAIDLESAALRRLIAEPAVHGWQIKQKIVAFETYMTNTHDRWTDQRAARLFGSIKSDLDGLLSATT